MQTQQGVVLSDLLVVTTPLKYSTHCLWYRTRRSSGRRMQSYKTAIVAGCTAALHACRLHVFSACCTYQLHSLLVYTVLVFLV